MLRYAQREREMFFYVRWKNKRKRKCIVSKVVWLQKNWLQWKVMWTKKKHEHRRKCFINNFCEMLSLLRKIVDLLLLRRKKIENRNWKPSNATNTITILYIMCNLANLSRVTFWRTFSNFANRTKLRIKNNNEKTPPKRHNISTLPHILSLYSIHSFLVHIFFTATAAVTAGQPQQKTKTTVLKVIHVSEF